MPLLISRARGGPTCLGFAEPCTKLRERIYEPATLLLDNKIYYFQITKRKVCENEKFVNCISEYHSLKIYINRSKSIFSKKN